MSEIFAFEWCDCVYESAFGIVSLHATKDAAYRAMRRKLVMEAEEDRKGALQHGDCYRRGWNGLLNQAWRVRRIEVQQ